MSDFRDLLDIYNIEQGEDDLDNLLDAIERECEAAEDDDF